MPIEHQVLVKKKFIILPKTLTKKSKCYTSYKKILKFKATQQLPSKTNSSFLTREGTIKIPKGSSRTSDEQNCPK